MKKNKFKYPSKFIIYHLIERLMWSDSDYIVNKSYIKLWKPIDNNHVTILNSKNENWKYFFKQKYDFLKYWDKYANYEESEKDLDKVIAYIYHDNSIDDTIEMMDYFYHEIFSYNILHGEEKYFYKWYRWCNMSLFEWLLCGIEFRELNKEQIFKMKVILIKNYKRAKLSENHLNKCFHKIRKKWYYTEQELRLEIDYIKQMVSRGLIEEVLKNWRY